MWKPNFAKKLSSESSLLTIYARGAWFQSYRPRRLFTVLYFSVRSLRSRALRYGLPTPAPSVHLKIKMAVTVRLGIFKRSHEKTGGLWTVYRPRYFILSVKWNCEQVLLFGPVRGELARGLNEKLTMILISANWEVVLNTTVIKSVLNLENHAIYTHVRTATIDYFHYLFFSLFFIVRNKAVYIYCWTPEDKNWCAYVGWNESRTALLTNDTINYINSRQPRPLHFNTNPIELNSPLVC